MLSRRLTALSTPANQTIATMVSAACAGVRSKVESVSTKKAATASELTIFARADNGARSSYQTDDEQCHGSGQQRGGWKSDRSAGGSTGEDAKQDRNAAESRSGRPVPAVGPRRNDGSPGDRDLADDRTGRRN